MGILGALFGGSKSKSGNQAYGDLKGSLTPAISGGMNSFNNLNSELAGGFEGFKKNAGFDFAMGEGLKGITGAGAARGTLNSGMTGKAYQRFGTGLASQFYDNYLNKLKDSAGIGLGAAGTLAGAGQTSSGKSNGGILTSLFSDRRLKQDITPVGKLDNGLTVYSYRYVDSPVTQIGLMADEVLEAVPEAVGQAELPSGTYLTVDYAKAVK
jgi:hypothetical protein